MKNLKRALSFAVAAVMLIGMMAVGTSAFTDDADIVNTKAVNVMNQLGIIAGKPDGSFDPAATVTRGEMAKMICVALNGGKAPVLDNTVSTYPDTVGHWAAGYIEYCSSLGIVAGSTDGNFYPNAPITGTEAAKMVAIALGYNAENEKFVNNKDWSTNINVVANKKGLYEDVTSLPGAPISRDNAAQMLYNGMSAVMVEYEYQLTTNNGDLVSVAVAKDKAATQTILNTKFYLNDEASGIVADVEWNETDECYDVTIEGVGTIELANDVSDLFMQKVTVLQNTKTGDYFGIFADSKVIAEAVVADIDLTTWDGTEYTVEVDGVETKVASTTIPVYELLNDTTASDLTTYAGVSGNAPFSIKLIDNDADKKADMAVAVPYTVGTVTYVGKTQVITSAGTFVFEDHNVYTGIAKDDYIKVAAAANTVDNKATVTELTEVTGTVEALKSYTVKIDGEWYTSLCSPAVTFDLGKDYDMVALNGYIYYAEKVTEKAGVSDVLAVVDADTVDSDFGSYTQKVKVMFADGTTAVVTVDKLNGEKVNNTNYKLAVDTVALYTFDVDTDGNYELTDIVTADYSYKTGSATVKDGKATIAGEAYRFNADATLWVKTTDDGEVSVKVISGADTAKWDDTVTMDLYGEVKNGFVYTQFALIDAGAAMPGTDTDTAYGMVTSAAPYQTKVGDDKFINFTVWNGAKEVELTVKVESGMALTDAEFAKGALISYEVVSGNEVKTVAEVANIASGSVVAYDGTFVAFDGVAQEYKITEDTVIIYVDSKKVAGAEGGVIAIANKDETNTAYVENVYYVCEDATTDYVKVIFVDVNNDWEP